ncbi:MAG TPA: helix-turn-helix transcriptional regulator [Methylocella sp.]|jgi:DNA-binding CsgD family transcriptional regulator|nr:helix-turn-helix transcriptional regulator [Methylocella sp.]
MPSKRSSIPASDGSGGSGAVGAAFVKKYPIRSFGTSAAASACGASSRHEPRTRSRKQENLADEPAVLSARERVALQWAAEGKGDWEIGEVMNISEHGADKNLRSIRAMLAAINRTQAVAEAIRRGLIA